MDTLGSLGAVQTLTQVHPTKGTLAHGAAARGHLESLKNLHKALKAAADNDRKLMSRVWSKLRLGDAERVAFDERVSTQSRLAVRHKVEGHPQPSTPAEVATRAGHTECALFLSSI
jgi:hypothetical protein